MGGPWLTFLIEVAQSKQRTFCYILSLDLKENPQSTKSKSRLSNMRMVHLVLAALASCCAAVPMDGKATSPHRGTTNEN